MQRQCRIKEIHRADGDEISQRAQIEQRQCIDGVSKGLGNIQCEADTRRAGIIVDRVDGSVRATGSQAVHLLQCDKIGAGVRCDVDDGFQYAVTIHVPINSLARQPQLGSGGVILFTAVLFGGHRQFVGVRRRDGEIDQSQGAVGIRVDG